MGNMVARGMFDQAALNAVVKKTLDENVTIPEGARGAFVLVANNDGIKAVTALKIKGDWQIRGVVEYDRADNDVQYGVSVTGTF